MESELFSKPQMAQPLAMGAPDQGGCAMVATSQPTCSTLLTQSTNPWAASITFLDRFLRLSGDESNELTCQLLGRAWQQSGVVRVSQGSGSQIASASQAARLPDPPSSGPTRPRSSTSTPARIGPAVIGSRGPIRCDSAPTRADSSSRTSDSGNVATPD
jgi:hypothetical protein